VAVPKGDPLALLKVLKLTCRKVEAETLAGMLELVLACEPDASEVLED
jgi:hypothetical protein